MRVWSVSENTIGHIAHDMGITVIRLDHDRKGTNVTLRPIDSKSKYSRSSYQNMFGTQRRGPWLCYHGFEEFIRQAFDAGATRIKSSMGDWDCLETFEYDLDRLSMVNVGSIVCPAYAGPDCPCDCEDGCR